MLRCAQQLFLSFFFFFNIDKRFNIEVAVEIFIILERVYEKVFFSKIYPIVKRNKRFILLDSN